MKYSQSVAIHIPLIIVFLFALIPLTWLILASINPAAGPAAKIPSRMTMENFGQAFSGRPLHWTLNSLLIAGSTATLVLFLATMAAYPFSRVKFFGANILLYGLVFLRTVPVSSFMLPVYLIFIKLNLVNTHLSVIITLSVLNIPFALLLLKGFYDTIPTVFEEASWIDGCSKWKSIFYIVLPQCGPGLAVAWFMTFMFAWGEFLIPFILLRKLELMPLSVGIFTTYGQYGVVNYGLLSAMSLLYAIPPILMYILIQKNLVKGMVGYVKG